MPQEINLKLLNLLLSLSICTSCGYRWQPELSQDHLPTVTIPYVDGDEDGSLTAAISQALSQSGLATVRSYGGEYRLQASISKADTETIGYRIDPQKVDGEVRKNLLSTEGRKTITLQVSWFKEDELKFGPYQISADAEYDFVDGDSIQDLTFVNPTGQSILVLPFSLGQLEPSESAQEGALKPLYSLLAEKVVDAISSEW